MVHGGPCCKCLKLIQVLLLHAGQKSFEAQEMKIVVKCSELHGQRTIYNAKQVTTKLWT